MTCLEKSSSRLLSGASKIYKWFYPGMKLKPMKSLAGSNFFHLSFLFSTSPTEIQYFCRTMQQRMISINSTKTHGGKTNA